MKSSLVIALGLMLAGAASGQETPAGAPQLFLDKSPAVVKYQLKRLSNAQLLAIPRKAEEAKYRPVYEAILTRKGMDRKYRDEALASLVKMNQSDPVTELIKAIGAVGEEDRTTPRELAGMLMMQKPEVLKQQREKLEALAKESDKDLVKQAAYAGVVTADGGPAEAWKLASENAGVKALLQSVPMVLSPQARAGFWEKVKELAGGNGDDSTAAVEAMGYVPGHETEAFSMLSGILAQGPGQRRDAAVRAIGRIPAGKWPKDAVEPLAKALLKLVEQTPGDQRTSAAVVQAVQLGNDLAAALPAAQGAAIRKSLRGLAVRVVMLHTLREQMQYDLKYFTVQAGKPVQVVLENDDTMPHNFVVVAPMALVEVGTASAMMVPPDDPQEPAFIPKNPKVLHFINLVQPEENGTLSFTAPTKPGEYPYLCTYPGHWIKMYGVMQVVDDLDQWDQKPTAPKDPLSMQAMKGQKNEPTVGGEAHQH